MAAKLMIGCWFGIGVILAVRMVDNLDHCVETLMSSKYELDMPPNNEVIRCILVAVVTRFP